MSAFGGEADTRRTDFDSRRFQLSVVWRSEIFVQPIQRALPGQFCCRFVVAGCRVVMEAVIGASIHKAFVRNMRRDKRPIKRRPS